MMLCTVRINFSFYILLIQNSKFQEISHEKRVIRGLCFFRENKSETKENGVNYSVFAKFNQRKKSKISRHIYKEITKK